MKLYTRLEVIKLLAKLAEMLGYESNEGWAEEFLDDYDKEQDTH